MAFDPRVPIWVAKMLLARRRKKARERARKAELAKAQDALLKDQPMSERAAELADQVVHQVVRPGLDTLRGVRDTIVPLFGSKEDSDNETSGSPECPKVSDSESSNQSGAEEPSASEADE